MVDRVERVDGAGTPHRHDRRTGLARERVAVAARDVARAVDDRLDLGCDVGEVGGAAQKDRVGLEETRR